ncbi:MAG: cadmium-translocating P-type ATPase [Pseudomonadota bacterium]|nr:cadmium-translocating P-type ATPase [Pseudomonadota bacterium]
MKFFQAKPAAAVSAPLKASRHAIREKDGGYVLPMVVAGMHCPGCAFRIEEALNSETNVAAKVNVTTRRLTVRWPGPENRADFLIKKVTDLGYRLQPFEDAQFDSGERHNERRLLHCLIMAGLGWLALILIGVASWALGFPENWVNWADAAITVPLVLYTGQPFLASAWRALRHGGANMDVPISVALLLTLVMSLMETLQHGAYVYFESALMLAFLLLVGRYLDTRTRGHARAAAQDLLAMMTGTATVREDAQLRLIPIRELRPGMLLQVAAGEKIAADGIVETGISEIDPSAISGETMTEPVRPGSTVFGGMVNVVAPLTVRISSDSGDSLLGEVIKLMEKAEQSHAKYTRLADRVARAYTPVVHSLALGTFLVWWLVLRTPWEPSLLTAMTVLIITCPCALGLAVPAVQVLTSGRLFRRGMLLKSADAIERLAKVDTIVFDKTGTLTSGKMHLANEADISLDQMQMAASLAAQSKHPLARALQRAYSGRLLPLTVTETAAEGLEAYYQGKLVRLGRRQWCGDANAPADESPELWLHIEDEATLRLIFSNETRPDAAEIIKQLQARNYEIFLLSGDRATAVTAVAKSLGITNAHAGLSPTEKCAFIEKLMHVGKNVLMVGDGLNDAAALTAADVSMSPSSALDIAQNAADIVFQGENLAPVAEALATARRAHHLIQQNFALALLYNLIAVPVAVLGYTTPLIAAVAMASSSLAVVLNAQRVNRVTRMNRVTKRALLLR